MRPLSIDLDDKGNHLFIDLSKRLIPLKRLILVMLPQLLVGYLTSARSMVQLTNRDVTKTPIAPASPKRKVFFSATPYESRARTCSAAGRRLIYSEAWRSMSMIWHKSSAIGRSHLGRTEALAKFRSEGALEDCARDAYAKHLTKRSENEYESRRCGDLALW